MPKQLGPTSTTAACTGCTACCPACKQQQLFWGVQSGGPLLQVWNLLLLGLQSTMLLILHDCSDYWQTADCSCCCGLPCSGSHAGTACSCCY